MKKLLGVFACLCALAVMGIGTTGCKKDGKKSTPSTKETPKVTPEPKKTTPDDMMKKTTTDEMMKKTTSDMKKTTSDEVMKKTTSDMKKTTTDEIKKTTDKKSTTSKAASELFFRANDLAFQPAIRVPAAHAVIRNEELSATL